MPEISALRQDREEEEYLSWIAQAVLLHRTAVNARGYKVGLQRSLDDNSCTHPRNLINRSAMNSLWRKHLMICVVLGLLAVPMYFLDRALLSGGGGGSWINLDFRGLIFWTYVIWVAIHVVLSSVAVLLFPKARALPVHLASAVLAVVLLITAVAVYGKVRRVAISNEYQKTMADRKPLMERD